MITEDKIFNQERSAADFEFDEEVVGVFDDMVSRSVPFYGEIQRMMAEIVRDHAVPDTNVYDLGCATGNTLLAMDRVLDPSVGFVGVDNSAEMLSRCEEKLKKAGVERTFSLECAHLDANLRMADSSVAVLCLTLQFVRPPLRQGLLQAVHGQLNDGGCLILVEKLICEDPGLNRSFIRYYYDFKRRMHYSDLEIAQKRESLENVLVPYTGEENAAVLRQCGFAEVETFFRWYNFAGMVALKA